MTNWSPRWLPSNFIQLVYNLNCHSFWDLVFIYHPGKVGQLTTAAIIIEPTSLLASGCCDMCIIMLLPLETNVSCLRTELKKCASGLPNTWYEKVWHVYVCVLSAVATCTTSSACSRRTVGGPLRQSCNSGGAATSVPPAKEEGAGLLSNQKEAAARPWHRCVFVRAEKKDSDTHNRINIPSRKEKSFLSNCSLWY